MTLIASNLTMLFASVSIIRLLKYEIRLLYYPEKTTYFSRSYHWFPRELTAEERMQKFHTDDASIPRVW